MKKNITKKVVGTLAAALCMSMTMSVMAAPVVGGDVVPVPDGTDVYAGTIVDQDLNTDARIRVTVPTVFAFVVNGSTTETTALSVADGTIMLPNVTVAVNADKSYTVNVEQDSAMTFTNYSTKADAGAASGRVGLPLELSGAIENRGTASERNNWTHTATATGVKEFNISVDGKKFDKAKGNALEMASTSTLAAPNVAALADVDATTLLAKNGAAKDLPFSVAVGGTRSDYNKVEQSAKVGTIVWTVGYTVTP